MNTLQMTGRLVKDIQISNKEDGKVKFVKDVLLALAATSRPPAKSQIFLTLSSSAVKPRTPHETRTG